ncbi:hypothetical protein [Dokdonella sp.]|uniref:hypothetical protein n=1 Tax=Dokdonella sp. TaxID=2291710 RepID=UPI002F3FDE95
MSRLSLDGDRATFHDIPMTMKAAAADVLAEASAARRDLRETAAQLADDLRAGAGSMQLHARRARAIGGSAALDAVEMGRAAGASAWREARRHAADWGHGALEQARSRPAAVLVGVAVIGVAIGFWLRGASQRASRDAAARRSTTARVRAPQAGRASGKGNGAGAGRRSHSATAAHE